MKFSIAIIILLFCGFSSFAQYKEFEFKNLTTENGLPSNESYFIYRDSRNYMWFATDQGVVRFNGSKMEKFDLPDNVVFKIYEDSKGRIWFFSHSGKLAYFYNEVIYPYKYNHRITKAFKSILITSAYVNDSDEVIINSFNVNIKIDAKGIMSTYDFIATGKENPGVLSITEIKNKTNQFFVEEKNMVSYGNRGTIINLRTHNSFNSIKVATDISIHQQYGCISDNGKDFYFYYGNHLIRFNKDGAYKSVFFPSVINCVEFDKNNLWVGFLKNGTILLDTALNVLYQESLLKDKSVTSIRKDYEGGIWFSTLEKGILYLKNSNIKRLTGDSILNENIFCMNVNSNSLLLGNKDGVYRLSNNKISPVLHQKYNRIAEIFTDSYSNLLIIGSSEWRNCYVGEYVKTTDAYLKTAVLPYSISEAGKLGENKYFINSYSGSLYFHVTPQLNTKRYNCLDYFGENTTAGPAVVFADSKKNIWRGTINGLYIQNPFIASSVQFKPDDSLFGKGVSCMRQIYNDTYVIGIRFGGIAIMQDTTVIGSITEKNGLLSNSIKYLLPIKDQLWAATAKGISIISFQSYAPVKYSIINIGKNEGFYNVIINQLMTFGSSMLAATSNGIYEIENAGQFLNYRPRPIYFYINSVSSYKGDTTGINSITLPYNKNRVIIKYSAVCFNLAEEIKYYYRFDNADTNWYEIASTELLLENLTPGDYNLQIKAAATGEQRYSDVKIFRIIIEKAWWQNNWLKLLVVIMILGLVYLYLKNRFNKIAKRENQNASLKTRMVELEQTALRSQMNPHFIFNCLTSIQQLIISGNKTDANEYLVKFARLIRKTLDLSAKSYITVEEEVDYIKEYMILEQLRIPGQFEFFIDIDAGINVLKTEIPGMMLQPIIENSIRHGIKHLENKNGNISISLKQEAGYILCCIIDNGVGRAKSVESKGSAFRENKSYGMEIINKRLSAISFNHENEGTLAVEDLFNEDGSAAGTKVTMHLPFKTKQL